MSHVKKLAYALVAGVALLAVGIGGVAWKVDRFMATPVNVGETGATFEIAPGSAFGAVTRKLVEQGIVETDFWFRVYARFGGDVVVQAGEYEIKAGTTGEELLEQFAKGGVRLYSFTIVEGWNHRDLLAALHKDETLVATMTDEDWPVLLAELGASVAHPEGLFLPETYRFPRGTTDRDILRQAYDLMQQVLEDEWQRKGDTPVQTPYEALVLASIVEKETALADERPRIAGVFARRLDKRKDLRTDTPYNTNTRHGLPPTPIAMPGQAAINAVLHPAEGDELFFVATGLGDGSHKFSVTKEEHDAAVAEYLQRLRQRRRESR